MSFKDREKFISSYHYTLQNHNVWYRSVFRLYLPLGIFSCLLPHRTFHAPLCNVCHRDPTLSIYSTDHWELFENCQIIQLKHKCEILKGVSYPREMFISTREDNILILISFIIDVHQTIVTTFLIWSGICNPLKKLWKIERCESFSFSKLDKICGFHVCQIRRESSVTIINARGLTHLFVWHQ